MPAITLNSRAERNGHILLVAVKANSSPRATTALQATEDKELRLGQALLHEDTNTMAKPSKAKPTI